jgi:hypothetical protein
MELIRQGKNDGRFIVAESAKNSIFGNYVQSRLAYNVGKAFLTFQAGHGGFVEGLVSFYGGRNKASKTDVVREDLSTKADMSMCGLKTTRQLRLGIVTFLNTVLLWKKRLVDIFSVMKRFTTKMVSAMITGLRTLNFGQNNIHLGRELVS